MFLLQKRVTGFDLKNVFVEPVMVFVAEHVQVTNKVFLPNPMNENILIKGGIIF